MTIQLGKLELTTHHVAPPVTVTVKLPLMLPVASGTPEIVGVEEVIPSAAPAAFWVTVKVDPAMVNVPVRAYEQ
jgi:hypothetical protein